MDDLRSIRIKNCTSSRNISLEYIDCTYLMMSCSCGFYTSMGLPCRHMLHVRTFGLRGNSHLIQLPEIYQRWMTGHQFHYRIPDQDTSNPIVSIDDPEDSSRRVFCKDRAFINLLAKAKRILSSACLNEQTYLKAFKALDNLIDTPEAHNEQTMLHDSHIKPPKVVTRRGRPPKKRLL